MIELLLAGALGLAGIVLSYRSMAESVSKVLTLRKRMPPHESCRYEGNVFVGSTGDGYEVVGGLRVTPSSESLLDHPPEVHRKRMASFYRMLSELSSDVEVRLVMAKQDVTSLLRKLSSEMGKLTMLKELEPDNRKWELRRRIVERAYEELYDKATVPFVSYVILLRLAGRNLDELLKKLEADVNAVKVFLQLNYGLRAERLTSAELRRLGLCVKEGHVHVMKLNPGADDLLVPYPAQYARLPPRDEALVYVGDDIDTGYPVFAPFHRLFEKHHLVVGPTGAGKTTYVATIIARYLAADGRHEVKVLALDPKGDLANMARKCARRDSLPLATWRVEAVDEGMARLLSGHVSAVLDLSSLPDAERNEVLASVAGHVYALRSSGGKHLGGRVVLVVDEAWRLLTSNLQLVRKLFREGRSLGIGLCLITQSPEDVPFDIAVNTGSYAVFGSGNLEYLEMTARMFGLEKHLYHVMSRLDVGEALIKLPERPYPVPVRIKPVSSVL